MHLASDQKDLLISQLKAEIFEIQQRDKDFLALRDQLYSIQSKYRHLQDEKVSVLSAFVASHVSHVVVMPSLNKRVSCTEHTFTSNFLKGLKMFNDYYYSCCRTTTSG